MTRRQQRVLWIAAAFLVVALGALLANRESGSPTDGSTVSRSPATLLDDSDLRKELRTDVRHERSALPSESSARRSRVVRGFVTDARSGALVADAEVTTDSIDASRSWTDARGEFLLDVREAPGFRVEMRGYESLEVTLDSLSEPCRLELEPAASGSLEVTWDHGAPVAGAEVLIGGTETPARVVAKTDEHGLADLPIAAPTNVVVRSRHRYACATLLPGASTAVVMGSGGVQLQLCDAERRPWPTPVDFEFQRTTASGREELLRLRWEGPAETIAMERGQWTVRLLEREFDLASIVVDGAVVHEASDDASTAASFFVHEEARVVQLLIRGGSTFLLTNRVTQQPVETHVRVLRQFTTMQGTQREYVVFEGDSNARGEVVAPVIDDGAVVQLVARGFERTQVDPFEGRNEARCPVFLTPAVESTLSIRNRSGAPYIGSSVVYATRGSERRLVWAGRVPADGDVSGLFLTSGFGLELEDSRSEVLVSKRATQVNLGGRTELVVPRSGASLRLVGVPANPPPIVARDRGGWNYRFSPTERAGELRVDGLQPGTYYVGLAPLLTSTPFTPSALGGRAHVPAGVTSVDLADGEEHRLAWRDEWDAPEAPFRGNVALTNAHAPTATLVPVYELLTRPLSPEGATHHLPLSANGDYELPPTWGTPRALLVCAQRASGPLDLLDVIRPGQSTSIECASLRVELESDDATAIHWRLQLRLDDLTLPANLNEVSQQGELRSDSHLILHGLPASRGTLTAWHSGWKRSIHVALEDGEDHQVILER